MKPLLFLLLVLMAFPSDAQDRRRALIAEVNADSAAGGGGGGYNKLFDVGAAGAAGGGNPTTSAVDSSGATLIVIGVAYYITAPTISDSKGNTYTLRSVEQVTECSARIYECENPIVGSGHTFTGADGDGVAMVISVLGFSGNAATPFDAETGDNTGALVTLQPGSITPAGANELFITYIAMNNAGADADVNSGFTELSKQNGGDGVPCGIMAWKIKTDATAENPTWTATALTPKSAAVQAAFK